MADSFFSALSKVFNAVNETKSFQIFPSPEAVCNRRTFNIISTSIKLKSAKRLIFVQKILILKVSLFSLMNLEFSIQTYLHLPTCRILYISNVLKRVIGKENLLSLRNWYVCYLFCFDFWSDCVDDFECSLFQNSYSVLECILLSHAV